jgi:hypothetical protein
VTIEIKPWQSRNLDQPRFGLVMTVLAKHDTLDALVSQNVETASD